MMNVFDSLSGMLGLPADHLRLLFCVAATYPSAMLYRRLPPGSPTSRHLFSIAYTCFTMLYMLSSYVGFLHIGSTCLVSYLFVKYYRGPRMPWINFAIAMISMSICHLDRQFKGVHGDTKLDYSGGLMIVTVKLSSFGFNVHDGRGTPVTDYNRQMMIQEYPSPIQFAGWICYYCGFLTGPSCEYMDYFRFTTIQLAGKEKEPEGRKRAAFKVLRLALCLAAYMIVFGPYFHSHVGLEDHYFAKPFYQRMFLVAAGSLTTRIKYYTVWKLSEGSCILSGLGYNGLDSVTGKPLWNRLNNADIKAVEFGQSLSIITRGWNIGVNTWLRHYVYLRVSPPGKKPSSAAVMWTYVMSSLWHGFHPGYYLFFINIGLYQVVGRMARRSLRPLAFTPDGKQAIPHRKRMYDIAGLLGSQFAVDMLVSAFDLLTFSNVWRVWSGIHFIQLWVLLAAYLIARVLEPVLLSVQKKRMVNAGIGKTAESKVDEVVDELAVNKMAGKME